MTISRRYVPQIITPNAAVNFPTHKNKYRHCNSKKWICESCRMFGKYSHRVDSHAVQQERKKYLTLTILYCAAIRLAQLFLVVKFLLFTINCYMFRFLYQSLRRFIPVALWIIRITVNSVKTQLFTRVLTQQHVSA